jgi:hypothetical protein
LTREDGFFASTKTPSVQDTKAEKRQVRIRTVKRTVSAHSCFLFMADTRQLVQDGTWEYCAVKIPTLAGKNGICRI